MGTHWLPIKEVVIGLVEQMPRRASPRKDGVTRSKLVPMKMTPEEKDRLKLLAQQCGLSLSEYSSSVILGKPIPSPVVPEANREIYKELARIGANLNQLTKAVNSKVNVGGACGEAYSDLFGEAQLLVRRLQAEVVAILGDSDDSITGCF